MRIWNGSRCNSLDEAQCPCPHRASVFVDEAGPALLGNLKQPHLRELC